MNNSNILDVVLREEQFVGVYHFPNEWIVKLFFITSHNIPYLPMDRAIDIITNMLQSINERMSSEFDYSKCGFAIVHTGRRGICITIWHFGAWGKTFEFFSSAWYRYGYGYDNFELLNDLEPAFCWFEFNRTTTELRSIYLLAKSLPLCEIREKYISNDTPYFIDKHKKHIERK